MNVIQTLLLISVASVSVFYPHKLDTKKSIIIIFPVVIFTLIYLLDYQVFKLAYLAQGLVAGILLFVFSILLTEKPPLINSIRQYSKNVLSVFFSVKQKFQDWDSVLFSFFMVLYEELIWRVFLVETLALYLPVIPVILIASFFFSYSHASLRNVSLQSLDLFLFSLVLTTTYYFTRDYYLVVLIHLIRNLLIIFNSIGARESINE